MSKARYVLVGGSGFVGQEVGVALVRAGAAVTVVSRNPSMIAQRLSFPCDLCAYDEATIDPEVFEGATGVVCLAGASIAEGRWTKARKQLLRSSRIRSALATTRAIAACKEKPQVYVQASAVGAYNDGFLGDLCAEWEGIAKAMSDSVRTVIPRIGVVFGWGGGAWAKLNDVYAVGIGARLGNGEQWLNPIHIEDLARFIITSLENPAYEGTFDLVCPENTTYAQMHDLLAGLYPSWRFMRTPALALRILLGEAAELVTVGPRLEPKRAMSAGFSFVHSSLAAIIRELNSARRFSASLQLQQRQWVARPVHEVWKFFSDAKNLEVLTPSWLNFKILGSSAPKLTTGTRIDYRLKLHGIPIHWQSVIEDWHENRSFSDLQKRGPYKIWYHDHRFEPLEGGTLVTDAIDYRLPFLPLSAPILFFVQRDLQRIFQFRKNIIAQHFTNPQG